MEWLVIELPDSKSKLVKQLLKKLGVGFKDKKVSNHPGLQKALLYVSVWSEDIEALEEIRPFEGFKPMEW